MSDTRTESGDERLLRAGTVGRAHGLDGSFRVGDPAAAVLALVEVGSRVTIAGAARTITRVAGHAARPLLGVEGVDTREAAEALTGSDILVARSDAGELGEDEWWAEDLEGCRVRDGDREVGVVTALLELPSCEVLEVERAGEGGGPLLVPLIRDAVREVDLDAGTIDVDLAFLGEA